MAALVRAVATKYNALLAAGDPRVSNLLLMQNPIPITIICAVYVYFVLSLGPRLMKNRKPLEMKSVLIVYNAAQSVFSAWLFVKGLIVWLKVVDFGFVCKGVDFTSQNEYDLLAISLCHYYFLSKITELADTVFFVLRKKGNHISLLHVFHHAAMPFSVWFGVKYHAGGNLAFFGIPNLFVHIWMYLYYMIAAMGPKYQKYLWWKRQITQMQLAQFAIVMVYMMFVATSCQEAKIWLVWIISLDIVFIYLFVDFYRKAYRPKKAVNGVMGNKTAVNGVSSNGTLTNGISANGLTNGDAHVLNGKIQNGHLNGGLKKEN